MLRIIAMDDDVQALKLYKSALSILGRSVSEDVAEKGSNAAVPYGDSISRVLNRVNLF